MSDSRNNLTILQRGEPVLAQVADAVTDIDSEKVKQLIDDLKITVAEANGVGIAAPQVGESLRLFLMCSAPSERYPDAPLLPISVIINPEIHQTSAQQELGWEGCLSVKGKRALIPRYTNIKVSYLDDTGTKHNKTLTGFLARIFQHELDHLDGITFIERLDNESDAIDEQQWRERYMNESA
jgi:peptide deformylase